MRSSKATSMRTYTEGIRNSAHAFFSAATKRGAGHLCKLTVSHFSISSFLYLWFIPRAAMWMDKKLIFFFFLTFAGCLVGIGAQCDVTSDCSSRCNPGIYEYLYIVLHQTLSAPCLSLLHTQRYGEDSCVCSMLNSGTGERRPHVVDSPTFLTSV